MCFLRTILPRKLLVLAVMLFLFVPRAFAVTRRAVYSKHSDRYRRMHVEHRQYYIRHHTKWQRAKIIGGTAKTGMSLGGLVAGPPGMAVGAAAGTAYDLKTRKVKVRM